jgi:hypothetical protein
MTTHYWIGDYVGAHFDEDSHEIGIGVGAPILDYEIRKQPNIRPKWTNYDKQEVHHFHLHSIGSSSLIVGFSFRREQWVDFIGGRRKSGETNCDAQVIVSPFVTQDHRVATKQPLIRDVDCGSSGFGVEQLFDHMASGLSFLISGGTERFGLFDMLAGIGAFAYDFGAIFSDPQIITDPIQRSILSQQFLPYVKEIWDMEDKESEVYLSDIRYEPKGIWLIFRYPEWLEDAVRAVFGIVDEDQQPVPSVTVSGDLLWYRHDGWQDGTEAMVGRNIVGHGGWQQYKSVFASSDGVLYAISTDGNLYWYRHDGWKNGTEAMAGRNIVGHGGWQQYKSVFASSDGVLYAISTDGNLYWYRHDGWQDGTEAMAGRNIVGHGGWQQYKSVFASSDGILYGITSNGDLHWYRHNGWQDGTAEWTGNGIIVGRGGWEAYESMFATSDGVLYGIMP